MNRRGEVIGAAPLVSTTTRMIGPFGLRLSHPRGTVHEFARGIGLTPTAVGSFTQNGTRVTSYFEGNYAEPAGAVEEAGTLGDGVSGPHVALLPTPECGRRSTGGSVV